MGAFFQKIHVRASKEDQELWLLPAMAQLGYQQVEEEADFTLWLQATGAWTTLYFEDGDLEPSFLLTLVQAISACPGRTCLFVECVDSDFVLISLFQAGVQVDAGAIGTFYGDQPPRPNPLCWQELVKPGEMPSFLHLFSPETSFVFAEDALQELYPLLGIDCAAEVCPQADGGGQALYYRQGGKD